MIIGRDGKTVVVKHGELLRNVSKIYITRIQDYRGEESEREEAIYRNGNTSPAGDTYEVNGQKLGNENTDEGEE